MFYRNRAENSAASKSTSFSIRRDLGRIEFPHSSVEWTTFEIIESMMAIKARDGGISVRVLLGASSQRD